MTSQGLSLQLRQGPAGLGPKKRAEPRLVETQNVRLIEVERSVSVGPQWALGRCPVQCECGSTVDPGLGGIPCSVSVDSQWALGGGVPHAV